MAERIITDGCAPVPVMAQLETVATEHDVPVGALLDNLKEYSRFAVLDPRPDTLFVTGAELAASSWADRAPEAAWEALWAVYHIGNPHIGWDWNKSDEGTCGYSRSDWPTRRSS